MKTPSRNQEHLAWGVQYIPPTRTDAEEIRYRRNRAIQRTILAFAAMLAWVGGGLYLSGVIASTVTNLRPDDVLLVQVMPYVVALLVVGAITALIDSVIITRHNHRMKSLYQSSEE